LSPDRRELFFDFDADPTGDCMSEIVKVPLAGGPATTVVRSARDGNVAVAPAPRPGHSGLAFIRAECETDAAAAVVVNEAGQEWHLGSSPILGWATDGSSIVVSQYNLPEQELVLVDIDPQGQPTRWHPFNPFPDRSRTGGCEVSVFLYAGPDRFYGSEYCERENGGDLVIGLVDPEAARLTRPLTSLLGDVFVDGAALSPDEKYLLLEVHPRSGNAGDPTAFYRLDVEGGRLIRMRPATVYVDAVW
jgi:hypothetical protein